MLKTFEAVTFSGPDSDTPITELVAIQKQHPFVEFGVLWSLRRAGSPRYATRQWIEEATRQGLHFSLHLCGKVTSDLVENGIAPEIPGKPSRIQVNCNHMTGKYRWWHALQMLQLRSRHRLEFIFQVNDALGAFWVGQAEQAGLRVVPIFDASGGKGISPHTWSRSIPHLKCGFAGGIGEENVAAVAKQIAEHKVTADEFWLDMETKIRTVPDADNLDDRFDLACVQRVIEIVKPLIYHPSQRPLHIATRPEY